MLTAVAVLGRTLALQTDANISDGFVSLLTSLLTAAFAVSLLFFSAFHLHLVLTGQSTIEASLNRRARQNGGGGVAGAAGEVGAGAGGSGVAAEESLSLGGGAGSSGIDGGIDLELQRDGASPPPHAHAHTHPSVSSFSAGSKRANWDAVFGTDPWLWFIPLNTLHETGYEFEWLYEAEEGEDSENEVDLRPQGARIGAALAGNDSIGSGGGGSGGGGDSRSSLRDHDGLDVSISRSDSDRRSSHLSQDALADEEQSMSSLVRDLQMHD